MDHEIDFWLPEVEQVFRSMAPKLYIRAYILTHGDRYLAEDLVQETFCDALNDWAKIRSWSIARRDKWLFCALRNKAIDDWRRSSHFLSLHVVEEVTEDPGDVHQQAMCSIALVQAWRVIREMPPVRHRVAYLRWSEGWSVKEIAENLRIQPGTVRVHLKHAPDMLNDAIGPEISFLRELQDDAGEPDERGKAI